jgi:hypothetical protein
VTAFQVRVDTAGDRPEEMCKRCLTIPIEIDGDIVAIRTLRLSDAVGRKLARKLDQSCSAVSPESSHRL